jgi:N-acetylglucosamine-6-phosphate deacetylase
MLPRHPNYLWSQLAHDRLSASFIADGHHLPADTLRAMMRAKGVERSILVSDAVALAGMPPGAYDAPVGGRVTLSPEGRLSVAGTVFLAGAARPLIDGVANVARLDGFSLGDAIAMATENPGRFIGAGGELKVGAPADLLRFHWREGDAALRIDSMLIQGVEMR